ncbi:MAG: S-methyl-5-thioribose-1-phosphate isomerase [Gammaproteobacteria bacterium RIFCSPLOWO2_02_FULL_61_13]|nr:MAG: S-methyl-5-thioribose-1-phosphate isomerase [Gammaproteobacteria bacterium RIFCSPLOWO2_02_FULL_61_13]
MTDETSPGDSVRPLRWRDGAMELLDQRLLPGEVRWVRITSAAEAARAIQDMVVRGAPAIGLAAAYGVVLAAGQAYDASASQWRHAIETDLETLRNARPTAANLRWAIGYMQTGFPALTGDPRAALLAQARDLHQADIAANRHMGRLGAALLDKGGVLTHCNAGSLATGGYGTALGVVRAGFAAGLIGNVFVGETRPWLQGARLTTWELLQDGIPVTLLADSAAATLMRDGCVRWIIVGADRIAANGDVANKIGTYALAVLARHHGVRLMVVAPTSTFDPATDSGADIPIEQRDGAELRQSARTVVVPAQAGILNPVFDVTPAELVDVMVTEKGVLRAPYEGGIQRLFPGV